MLAPPPGAYDVIAPLPPDPAQPFWSVMIPTLDRTQYLAETLQSVLAQDPGPRRMQIEVVDNCSRTDEAAALVQAIGGGRISFVRHAERLALHASWNSCIRRARGQWVHLLHDDDVVYPGFYEEYERLIAAFPTATLVTGPSVYIDEEGRDIGISPALVDQDGAIPGFARRQAISNDLRTPATVVRRDVYERTGGVCSALSHTADWEMFFRGGTLGTAVATAAPLSGYRFHSGMDTQRAAMTGSNVREYLMTVGICMSRLPADERKELAQEGLERIAGLARGAAQALTERGEFRAALRQATWDLRLRPNANAVGRWLFAVARAVSGSDRVERAVRRVLPGSHGR